MAQFAELPTYDAYYFQTYHGGPYEPNALWLAVFGALADGIVRELNPRTVLDVGCAKGFLVESLRDRGVEAYGVDVSQHAIESVREDIRPFCWVGSIDHPFPRRYDLVVCMEVVEHLPADAADAAIANLCRSADDIFFSSTPDGFDEVTHLNVQPPEYWAGLFAKQGLVRDVDFAATPPFPGWALRFRRSTEPVHRQLASYERRMWALWRENLGMKQRALETHATLARQDEALRGRPSESELAETVIEQQAQLDALNERLTFMSDNEQSLRALLLDAHAQLLHRDQIIAGLTASGTLQQLQRLVDERTAAAEQARRDVELRDAAIRALQAEFEARAASAALSEERRETVLRLQALVDERTAWAHRAAADADARAQAVDAILRSSSWKVTAPLRLLRLRQRLGR